MTEMHDHEVELYPSGDLSESARALLAAADDLGLSPEVVRTVSDGGFRVPREVATKAGLAPKVDDTGEADAPVDADEALNKPEEKPSGSRRRAKRE